MSLTKLTTDLNIVTALDTEPNDVGGLTAAQLKAKFDEGPNAIKNYINNTLTEEAASKADLQGIVLGQIPDGTITEEKLETSVSNKINTAVQPEGMIDTAVALSDDVATALGLTGNAQVKDALEKLSGAALRKTTCTQLSALANGAEFTLNETISGTTSTVSFIKLKNDYQSSGRVLVIRKSAIAPMVWKAYGNAYSGSTLDNYLNNTYIGYLDSAIQAQLADVNIPYTIGGGNTTVSTLARKCFALSYTEYGLTDSTNANTEGASVSYFNTNAKRVASDNTGTAIRQWTRTPRKSTSTHAMAIEESGSGNNYTVETTDIYARPAFTLPADFGVNPVNSIVDMLGNDFPLSYAKIATGSYVGTGAQADTKSIPITPDTKMVFIIGQYLSQANCYSFVAMRGRTAAGVKGTGVGVVQVPVSWTDTQLNILGNYFNMTSYNYSFVLLEG